MRERHEARSRYHAFVEKQPFTNDDRALLNEEFKRRVMRGSGWDRACALPHVVDEEIEAAREDYRRAVKRSVVDLDLRVANKAKRMRERDGVEQGLVRALGLERRHRVRGVAQERSVRR